MDQTPRNYSISQRLAFVLQGERQRHADRMERMWKRILKKD